MPPTQDTPKADQTARARSITRDLRRLAADFADLAERGDLVKNEDWEQLEALTEALADLRQRTERIPADRRGGDE